MSNTPTLVLALQCPNEALAALAQRYDEQQQDDLEPGFVEGLRTRGRLSLEELRVMAYWKSPRIVHHINRNTEEDVDEITAAALAIRSERAAMGLLTSLRGVGFPMGSEILHFAHRDAYPILDYRALETLGIEQPHVYTLSFWLEYVRICRDLSHRAEMDMRRLDKALWQWSFEQRAGVEVARLSATSP